MPIAAANSSLELNLGYSRQAVKHVTKKLRLGGANWDYYRSGGSTWTYEGASKQAAAAGTKAGKFFWGVMSQLNKNAVDVCLYENVRPGYGEEFARKTSLSQIDKYRIVAEYAGKNGCGNCGENAILAFMYLYDLGVRPLDNMAVDQDHAFVVIGRKPGDVNDFATWGPVAVVCDPWAQGFLRKENFGTYPGTEFESRMTQIVGKFRVASTFRVD
jgi:hypothetical protein